MDATQKEPPKPAWDELESVPVRILDAVSDAYFALDSDFRIVYVNAAARNAKKSDDSFLGRTYWAVWPSSLGTQVEENLRRVLVERQPVHFTHHYFLPGEHDMWLDIRVYPSGEEDGGLYVVQRDITEQVRREERHRSLANQQARVAEALAQSLLIQPDLMCFEGVEVYPLYIPAANHERIGGDIYDAFALDGGGIALIVGDATGKGIDASTYAADIKFSLRAYLRLGIGADVFVVLRQMNRHVFDRQRLDGRPHSALLCLAMAVIEPTTGDLRLGGAGTEPPLILRAASGEVETIAGASGQIFGLSADWSGSVVSTRLGHGDILALYTDGLTEARRGKRGAFFGPEGVARALREVAASYPTESFTDVPLSAIADSIMGAVREHAGGTLNDDCCLLLARRTNRESRAG